MFAYLENGQIPEALPRAYRRMLETQKDKFLIRHGRLFRVVEFKEEPLAVPYLIKAD